MFKKIYCITLVLCMALSCSIAAASQITYDETSDEYCVMIGENSAEKIDSVGNFSFKIRAAVDSNKFTFLSSNTKITAHAEAVDAAGNIYPDVELNYKVDLRTSTLGVWHSVCASSGNTIGEDVSMYTNEIEVGKKYMIHVSVSDYDTGMYWISGTGHARNVDEVF